MKIYSDNKYYGDWIAQNTCDGEYYDILNSYISKDDIISHIIDTSVKINADNIKDLLSRNFDNEFCKPLCPYFSRCREFRSGEFCAKHRVLRILNI